MERHPIRNLLEAAESQHTQGDTGGRRAGTEQALTRAIGPFPWRDQPAREIPKWLLDAKEPETKLLFTVETPNEEKISENRESKIDGRKSTHDERLAKADNSAVDRRQSTSDGPTHDDRLAKADNSAVDSRQSMVDSRQSTSDEPTHDDQLATTENSIVDSRQSTVDDRHSTSDDPTYDDQLANSESSMPDIDPSELQPFVVARTDEPGERIELNSSVEQLRGQSGGHARSDGAESAAKGDPQAHSDSNAAHEAQQNIQIDEAEIERRVAARVAEIEQTVREKAAKEADSLMAEQLERFRESLESLGGLIAAAGRPMASEVAMLATHIAKELIGDELSRNPHRLAAAIEEALRSVASDAEVSLEMHPLDAAYLRAHPIPAVKLLIHENSQLTRGGYILEAPHLIMDASIEARLETVRDRISALLAEPGSDLTVDLGARKAETPEAASSQNTEAAKLEGAV